MKCSNCKEEVNYWTDHITIQMNADSSFSCSPKAERSGVPQGCPPSAPGSADARASDEAGADSLGRSADKAVRLLVKIIEDLRFLIHEHHSSKVMRPGHYICKLCSEEKYLNVLVRADYAIKQAALAVQRERACLPNVDLRQDASVKPKS